MDSEIQFGELERAPLAKRQRPDQNGHLAVAAVFEPAAGDLPIFVDLDVMRELLVHARSDPHVELGGVLVGGQFEDDCGQPFVQVTECLRARHYESTKGSFKFTHETWQQITRDREQFPPEAQMVGWYHTHPGWGVFLSSLDLFICEHFFNKPLDIALVMDPCQRDSGFFQWTEGGSERIRRTGGFMLYGSRFRQEELREVAADLEGQSMPDTNRSTQPPIAVHLPAPTALWQIAAVIGMLGIQMCLVVWLVLRWPQPVTAVVPDANWAAVQASLGRLERARQEEADIDAKLEVLELVLRQGGNAPAGVLQELADRGGQVEQLRASLRAEQSLSKQLETKISQLESQVATAQRSEEASRAQVRELEQQLAVGKRDLDPAADATRDASGVVGSPATDLPPSRWSQWIPDRWSFVIGAVLGALVAAAGLSVVLRREPLGDRSPADSDPAEPVVPVEKGVP